MLGGYTATKLDPRNITYMPVVIFFTSSCLDLDPYKILIYGQTLANNYKTYITL